ncbi:MAG: VCBS repeat-containing protein [Myxococcota bacterium]
MRDLGVFVGVALCACGPSSPVAATDGEDGTGSGSSTTSEATTAGTTTGSVDTSDDGVDDTSTTGEPELATCEPGPTIEQTPPPGSDCTPLPPQVGGLCHALITVDGLEEGPRNLDLFDTNADGLLDITVVGFDWTAVMLGVPQAWPRPAASSMVPFTTGPSGIGDLDADGHVDQVVGRTPLVLSYGDGNGGFTDRLGTTLPGPLTDALTADVDGDGLDDLVTLHDDGTVSVLRATGRGRLAVDWTRSSACMSPTGMVAGHFDDDGIIDLAIRSGDAGNVTTLHGDGSGHFTLGGGIDIAATTPVLLADDLDGDGISEVIVAEAQVPVVRVVDFSRGMPTPGASIALERPPSDAALVDLQGDGTLDLVFGFADAMELAWAYGQGDGTFGAVEAIETPAATEYVRIGDLNGDGQPDAFASDAFGTGSLAYGIPDGSFGTVEIGFAGAELQDYVLVDIDADGRDDLVSIDDERYATALTDPDGAPGVSESVRLPDVHTDLRFVLRTQLDDDPALDILVVGDEVTTLARLNDGSGVLVGGSATAEGYADNAGLAVDDFDGDPHPDFLLNGDNHLQVMHADGMGQLVPGATVGPLGGSRNRQATGNFDGAGGRDVLWAPPFGTLLSVGLGDGNGNFGTPVQTDVGEEVDFVGVGDMDEDGLDDLVADLGFDSITLFRAQGDGTFAEPLPIFVGAHGRLFVGDFNGDDHLDIGSYDAVEEEIVTAVGNGDGTFSPGQDYPAPFLSLPVAGDINGDGLDDAVLGGEGKGIRLLLSNPCGCG